MTRPEVVDKYYGQKEVAKICSRFVRHQFSCPDIPPPSVPGTRTPDLASFCAYAIYRTQVPSSVIFAALYLLQRLKTRYVAARGASGHRLFISALIVASKNLCDDNYSNKSWSVAAQNLFEPQEINQMETEMCGHLEHQLHIEPQALIDFERKVRRDFGGNGPYPDYATGTYTFLPSEMPSATPPATRPFVWVPPPTADPAPVIVPVGGSTSRSSKSSRSSRLSHPSSIVVPMTPIDEERTIRAAPINLPMHRGASVAQATYARDPLDVPQRAPYYAFPKPYVW